jgi:hypothetical protein
MRKFTKTIFRTVTIPSQDPALADTTWIVGVGPDGVSVRRQGSSKSTRRRMPWRAAIGTVLISGPRRE